MKKVLLVVFLLLTGQSVQAQDKQTVPDVSLSIKDLGGHMQTPFKLETQTASVLFFIQQGSLCANIH